MAEDDRPDFDLFSLLQGPATMMNGMRGLADNSRKAITGLLDTIASLQRAAAALELLASRVDRLVTDLETPLRLLTPELEKAASRVLRVAEIMEGPIDRLLPGLEQAVDTFDRLSLSQLPDNLDALRSQVSAVVDVFAELPRRLGSLGGFGAVTQLFPGLERLTNAASRLVPASEPQTKSISPKPVTSTKSAKLTKPTRSGKTTELAKTSRSTKTSSSAKILSSAKTLTSAKSAKSAKSSSSAKTSRSLKPAKSRASVTKKS
jgi:hypothetical protein